MGSLFPGLHLPNWNWEKEIKKFRRRPRRVEVAIWHDATLLCGFLGRVSDRCVVATAHFIQANPTEAHPLTGKVAQLITRFLQIYAVNLQCKEIAIDNPLPVLIEFYEKLGFTKIIKKGRKVLRLVQRLNS